MKYLGYSTFNKIVLKLLICVGSIYLLSCSADSDPSPDKIFIQLGPQNSEGLIYKSVTLEAKIEISSYTDMEWTYENVTYPTGSGSSRFRVLLSDWEDHSLSVQGKGNFDSNESIQFELDSVFTADMEPEILVASKPMISWDNIEGGISIIHSNDNWDYFLISYDPDFNVIVNKKLDFFPRYADFSKTSISLDKNLIVIDDWDVFLIDYKGNLLFNYAFAYNGNNSIFNARLVDNEMQVLRTFSTESYLSTIDINTEIREDFLLESLEELDEVIGLHFSDNGYLIEFFLGNNGTRFLYKDFDNNTLFDHIHRDLGSEQLKFIGIGWIAMSSSTLDTQVFTMMDIEGNIDWKIEQDVWEDGYYSYNGASKMDVIFNDDYIFLILDNYRVIKVTTAGVIIWEKFYMPGRSNFHTSSINSLGNLFLAGTLPIISATNGSWNDGSKNMIILKVDAQTGAIIVN